MPDRAIQPQPNHQINPDSGSTDFETLVEVTKRTLSHSSARVYHQTFKAWQVWATKTGLSPLDLNAPNVVQFLIDQPVTKSTRQRMLSALRTLAEMLTILDFQNPTRELALRTLERIKVPTEHLADNERQHRALTADEVDFILGIWMGDDNKDKRNRALITVLLATGMRRSEVVALRWSDIDLAEGVIFVRHGKGDKARDVAIYGDLAVHALTAWKKINNRRYVFCTINKGDNLGSDKPMTPTSLYRMVKETEKRAGVDHFSPHDARRTLITELLSTGTPLADAQAQAGHSQGQTTLLYARAADARQRRQKGKVRYG
jgi:integrase